MTTSQKCNLGKKLSWLVKDFSTNTTHLNEIVTNKLVFKWGEKQRVSFAALKEKQTKAPILALPNFSKSSTMECDASNVGVIMMQEGHLIFYFSEKLKGISLIML